jgi:hypothetical protein
MLNVMEIRSVQEAICGCNRKVERKADALPHSKGHMESFRNSLLPIQIYLYFDSISIVI